VKRLALCYCELAEPEPPESQSNRDIAEPALGGALTPARGNFKHFPSGRLDFTPICDSLDWLVRMHVCCSDSSVD
jgi:hypothetical protein